MHKVHLIVDSASDCREAFLQQENTHLIPLKIIFGEEEFLDGVNISSEEFYEKLIESEHLPTTSQAAVGDFEAVFRRVTDAGDTAVVITMSSRLSGTYQSACIAAAEFSGGIRVVDSLQVALGEYILADYALRLRNEGLDHNAIADELEEKRQKICLVALLDTLEYLKRGGRISKTAAIAGGLLSIKPVVSIVDGEVAILGKARGSKNGSNMLVEQIGKVGGVDFSMPYCLGCTGTDQTMLNKYIADSAHLWQGHTETLPVLIVGSAIGTHAGPGAIAVAFFHL